MSMDAPDVPARMPDHHWLSPLRDSGRLFETVRGRSDRALLYDAELKFAPHVTLERAEGNFRVKNSGEFPVHDVFVYRPTEDGQWNVWSVNTVDRSSKAKKAADEEEQDEEGETAEEVFEKPEAASVEASDEAVEGKASEGEASDDSNAGREAAPAKDEKKGLPAFVDKIKSGELPRKEKVKTQRKKMQRMKGLQLPMLRNWEPRHPRRCCSRGPSAYMSWEWEMSRLITPRRFSKPTAA
ncbi:MAG: hypothetical protein R3B91_09545 [Planctomycetaceae bacterium]